MRGFRIRLAEPLGALADVFRTEDLRRLGLAYVASLIGLWAYGIAVSVYAFRIGGAGLVGVSSVIRLLPAAALAPLTAILADRYPRRVVLLSTDFSRAILIAASASAVALDLPAVAVFAIAGIVTVVSTAFEPAKKALLPRAVFATSRRPPALRPWRFVRLAPQRLPPRRRRARMRRTDSPPRRSSRSGPAPIRRGASATGLPDVQPGRARRDRRLRAAPPGARHL
jgi:MFS family permease